MVYAVCNGTSHTLLVIIFCGFTILVNVQKIQFNNKLKFDDNGYFLEYTRKEKELKKQIDRADFFTIITSRKMKAEKALEVYRDRDAVEKIFRMEKTYLGNDVFRVHSDEHLESKIFISFIVLIIRTEIYKSLKSLYLQNRKEYTVPIKKIYS